MADNEKEDSEKDREEEETEGDEDAQGEDEPEKDEESVEELRARVAELEAKLDRARSSGGEGSQAKSIVGWIIGTLAAATGLALIIVILGGGWPWPCECEEANSELASGTEESQQREQEQLERVLRAHSNDFQECFESWASGNSDELRPGWAVIVRLVINADDEGRPQQVEASGENLPRSFGDCLESRVQLWTFPGRGPYTMELPFAIEGDPQRRPEGDSDLSETEDGEGGAGDEAGAVENSSDGG